MGKRMDGWRSAEKPKQCRNEQRKSASRATTKKPKPKKNAWETIIFEMDINLAKCDKWESPIVWFMYGTYSLGLCCWPYSNELADININILVYNVHSLTIKMISVCSSLCTVDVLLHAKHWFSFCISSAFRFVFFSSFFWSGGRFT